MILTIGSELTFLSWSIIYLRGDRSYTLLDKTSVGVVDNPIVANSYLEFKILPNRLDN
jgi:hypothetical protein